ncbi:Dyslexia-associated protein KIAA0319-like protein [Labeo rohita]|uniref:Dyslexia-associated protein KIAA0319-like protein n=1 Tax=Labeo rohita TaxID=84645 RepID=A0ABQ8LQF9_LABRO|nr:Dyslexia-associated protein KIAA0319-like protein [Labeo rohita]
MPNVEPRMHRWKWPGQFTSLYLFCLCFLCSVSGVSSSICTVTGGVLGIHWSSIIGLGWQPLAVDGGGPRCWESCCLKPSCGAVWSLGGRCVLLACGRKEGCSITWLPQPHRKSLGLLQELNRSMGRKPRNAEDIRVIRETEHEIEQDLLVKPTAPLTTSNITVHITGETTIQSTSGSGQQTALSAPEYNSTLAADTVDHSAVNNSNQSPQSTSDTRSVTPPPTPAVRELVVSAGKNVEVTLPRNEVELNAFVVPAPPSGANYAFDWRLRTHPKDYSGEMEGKHSKTLKLSKLTVGLYEFEVVVDGDGAHGEGYVNVTVKPEPRVNKPPVAVVSPKYQEISLPTSSTSTDDDKVVTWHWEEVKGPLREEKASVNKATDYRPTANAGPNQVITLPRNYITLYGNQSTDDHDNLSYEWSLSPESKGKVVEMQGVRTPILQLSALQEGDYTFQLTVTDSSGQQDTAQVTVIVQPENNKPPVADAGPDKELTLPVDRTTLDGSKSSDDQKIATYHWTKTKGPEGVKIDNADTAVAVVTGLQEGEYIFTLTVTDERSLENSDTVSVIVREEDDQPPVAKVLSSPPITLPIRTAFLDGSRSSDDKGSISYLWTREDSSPAAGDVLNNSDHQAVLFLGNLVEGKYTFTLTVTDSKGKTSTDRGTRDLVELILEVAVAQVSRRQKDMLIRQVGVLLGVLDSDITVREISAFNEHSVAMELRNKFRKQKNEFLIFRARRVDTVICQLNCSSHGECDSFTRRCVCHPFWMENLFSTYFWDTESNCGEHTLSTTLWIEAVCEVRRKSKVRRKSRYKMLEGDDQESLELQLPRPVPAPTSSALMHSDSDLESDDGQAGIPWSDRERGKLLKPQNGSLRNGQGPHKPKKQREELL